jgi:hypothetical protein
MFDDLASFMSAVEALLSLQPPSATIMAFED